MLQKLKLVAKVILLVLSKLRKPTRDPDLV